MERSRLGGLFILSATIVMVGTIFFEYQLGWIGVSRTEEESITFMADHWKELSQIWLWQAIANLLFTLSYLAFFFNSKGIKKFLWFILLLSGTMLVVSMGLTLYNYEMALSEYTSNPENFEAIRSIVKPLYAIGKYGSALFTFAYFFDAFGRGGVRRIPGLLLLFAVVSGLGLGFILRFDMKVVGALWFLLPFHFGVSILKNQPEPKTEVEIEE
jgi:hypothetical protein